MALSSCGLRKDCISIDLCNSQCWLHLAIVGFVVCVCSLSHSWLCIHLETSLVNSHGWLWIVFFVLANLGFKTKAALWLLFNQFCLLRQHLAQAICFGGAQLLFGNMPAPGQWKLDDLIQELHYIEQFAKTSPDEQKLKVVLAQFSERVKGCNPWTMKETLELIGAVKKSCLGEVYQKDLLVIAEEKALSPDADSHLRLQPSGQLMVTPWNYMSEAEWTAFPGLTVHEKISLMVCRLKKCGIKSLKEESKKWLAALVLHLHLKQGKAQPSPEEMYAWKDIISVTFKMESQQALWTGFPRYPVSPFELGDEFVQKVYGADQPSTRVLSGIQTLASMVPLRSTSALLQKNQRQVATPQQQQQTNADNGDSNPMLQALLTMMRTTAKMMDKTDAEKLKIHYTQDSVGSLAASSSSKPQLALECSGKPHGTTVQSCGLPVQTPAEGGSQEGQQVPETAPVPKTKSLEEYEKEAFDLLNCKKGKRTPSQPNKAL